MWSRRAVIIIIGAAVATLAAVLPAGTTTASGAAPPLVTRSISFSSFDGTVLHATVAGYGSLRRRPVIVEDSPYAPAVGSLAWAGRAYNYVELQWRGTGQSGGSLDATGPLDQRDLSDFLGWACRQSWSDRRIGLYGFSASAIVAYNSMHLRLPCVKAAALMAGSVDLYRDLLDIGGIPNLVPGAVVETSIGAPTLANGPARLRDQPASLFPALAGYPKTALDVLTNLTEDGYWRQRTFRGDHDRIPVLADTSFYDVEPRGPFRAFRATRRYGSHLLVYGAHDGFPRGAPGPFPQYRNWFDHYLRDRPLSAANQPTVSLYASNGSREQFLADRVTHLTGSRWPLRRTRWRPLFLSSARSHVVGSLNDGSLTRSRQRNLARQAYPFLPSEASETDLHTIAVIAASGLDQLAKVVPPITNLALSAPASLTYTTPALTRALTVVGPASLRLTVATSDPVSDLYVVVADVRPDGTAYPVGTGALRTAYPRVIGSRSWRDQRGRIVDPYADFSHPEPAKPLQSRRYQIEILPLGNRFAAGDRIRIYLLGTPFDQLASPPGLNTVTVGGVHPSRLLLPVIGRAPEFGQ